jgi:hypothetical protein
MAKLGCYERGCAGPGTLTVRREKRVHTLDRAAPVEYFLTTYTFYPSHEPLLGYATSASGSPQVAI